MIPVNISIAYNHCKNLLEELYISAILLRVFLNITAFATEISTNNYQVSRNKIL